MVGRRKIVGLGAVDELWASSFRESGFDFLNIESFDQISGANPDFLVFDARRPNFKQELRDLRQQWSSPILTLVSDPISRSDMEDLKSCGSSGSVHVKTPPVEVVWRVKAMLDNHGSSSARLESRSAHRVWFQEQIRFEVFGKTYSAWSTTLSETGIFLRTGLSFPLYSTMKLNFSLWGDSEPFSCDAVIVRQETEADLKGLGVMFQNLTGEAIRRLEVFFKAYS
jgi:hypothetical protein